MSIKFAFFAAAAIAASLVAGTAVQAAPLALFNTGVDASGTPLTDGVIGDPHYTLVGVPGGTSALRVRTAVGGFPIPPYIGDNAFSAWIGPNNDSIIDGPVGLYDYQTTFSLAGFNASTASIFGGWSTDNNGIKILLNGVDTGNPGTSFVQFATGFAPFSITSGFLAGLNRLDFIVNNGGGPTALRVEMHGSAALSGGIPEPTTWALMIGGFGMAGAMLRRRRTAVAA